MKSSIDQASRLSMPDSNYTEHITEQSVQSTVRNQKRRQGPQFPNTKNYPKNISSWIFTASPNSSKFKFYIDPNVYISYTILYIITDL